MRRFALIFPALLLAGCTIKQENGGDMRLNAPPLLAGNHWQITKQFEAPEGRVCIVSAGEMDITQRAGGKTPGLQVATSSTVSPGDYYRVIMGSHIYETPQSQSWFSPTDSENIINGLKHAAFVYTELQERVIQPGGEYRRMSNKITLAGFSEKFAECHRFIAAKP